MFYPLNYGERTVASFCCRQLPRRQEPAPKLSDRNPAAASREYSKDHAARRALSVLLRTLRANLIDTVARVMRESTRRQPIREILLE